MIRTWTYEMITSPPIAQANRTVSQVKKESGIFGW